MAGQPKRGRKKQRKSAPEPAAKPISQRAYAEHRKREGLPGATRHAIQQAIRAGRLRDSVVQTERGSQIADIEAADREWAAYTDVDSRPHSGPTAPQAGGDSRDELNEYRARKAAAAAELAELELAQKRGELVLARDVEARMVSVFSHCKNRLLGVPARARQRDPALTAPQVRLIEELIRESLEELAAGK